MKKIILGITAIAVTLLIFGCGRVQSAGGGSSGGGGGGTPQTFSIKGYVPAAVEQSSGMSVQDADAYSIKVLKFADNSQWAGNISPRSSDGYYEIGGLPLGMVFIVEAEKGQTKMRNLAFGSAGDKGQTKTADITPTSTVTVELISANAVELLKSFNESIDLTDAVTEVQDKVDTYYADTGKLTALETAITGGNAIPNLAAVKAVAIVEHTLTINISPADSGTVALTPSPNSSGAYLKNTKVNLLAKYNNEDWRFTGWAGDLGYNENPKEITMDGPKTVTANFAYYSENGQLLPKAYDKPAGWTFTETTDMSEWESIPKFFQDGDCIEWVKFVKDETKLYLAIKYKNPMTGNWSYQVTFSDDYFDTYWDEETKATYVRMHGNNTSWQGNIIHRLTNETESQSEILPVVWGNASEKVIKAAIDLSEISALTTGTAGIITGMGFFAYDQGDPNGPKDIFEDVKL
jgi:hypothetical protein